MTYQFGKAVSGGTPMNEAELTEAEIKRLEALYDRLRQPQQTDDLLDQRLAQELDYAQRVIEMVALELKRRNLPHLTGQLNDAKTVLAGVGGVISAFDRCDGVARASTDLKRRLLRDPAAGDDPICRRERIRRHPAASG